MGALGEPLTGTGTAPASQHYGVGLSCRSGWLVHEHRNMREQHPLSKQNQIKSNRQNIHTSHIRFGDVVVLTTTFIGRRGHATYDHPGATRGSRSRVTVHTSRGEQLLRGVTRTSSFHPRSSRPIRFLRISYHTRHPSRAPAPCLGHQLPRPEPLRSPTGTSTTILARERAVLCHCGCARLFAHNLFRAR